jgi:hypothetical protein
VSKEQHARAIRADRGAENPEQSLLDALADYMVLCGGDALAEVRDAEMRVKRGKLLPAQICSKSPRCLYKK